MDGHFLVGTAKVDVTPPLSVPYLGFSPRQGRFTAVHDPLYARAAVIGNGAETMALVSVDMIGYSNLLLGPNSCCSDVGAEFAGCVEPMTGIPAGNVFLFTTHAHSTPDTLCITPMERTPGVVEWFADHLEQLMELVYEATRSAKRCYLKLGQTTATDLAWNRRILGRDGKLYYWERRPPAAEIADWGANDPAVRIALFTEVETGQPVCTLVNYACHPTAVQAQPLISADFPGVAMRVVEQSAGGVALFLQGMAGDVGPTAESKGFAAVQSQGLRLAGLVLGEVGRLLLDEAAAQNNVVRVARSRVKLPSRTDAPREASLQRRRQKLLQRASQATLPARSQAALRNIEEQLRMLEIAGLSPEHMCDVAACRLGDLAIVTMPGEPFLTFGLRLQKASPAPLTFTVGYQGNYVGYLADRQAYERGGYEVSYGAWNRLGIGAGEELVQEAMEMLREAWYGR